MPSPDDSVNRSINGSRGDKSAPPDRAASGSVDFSRTRYQAAPPAAALPAEDWSAGQSSSGNSRELSFPTERGPVTCPEFIGEYRVIGLLGRGGMGNVFKVKNPFFNFEQALKMLDARLDTRESRQQFIVEMRTQAELEHTNVAKVHYAGVLRAKGKFHDQLYFVMSLEKGDLGDEVKRRGPFPPLEAAHVVRRLAKAIGLAHARGTFHCDLKPKNVLIGADGTPKITDFGLVKLLADNAEARDGRGGAFGTPSYMPPEQADGDYARVDARSDVYGLGAILYELLTGRPPYQGADRNEILWQVRNEKTPPTAVRKVNPKVPAWLEAVCHKCLEKDPAKRYATAAELEDELDRSLRPAWWKRHAKPLATAGVVAGLVAAVAALGYLQYAGPRERAHALFAAAHGLEPAERLQAYENVAKNYDDLLSATFVVNRTDLVQKRDAVRNRLAEAWSEAARKQMAEAEGYSKQGNRDRATVVLKKLIEDYEKRAGDGVANETADHGLEWAQALTALAKLQVQRREYPDAMKSLTEAKKRLTGDDRRYKDALASAFHEEGYSYSVQDKWEDALKCFTQGLQHRLSAEVDAAHPDYVTYCQNLARSHGYLGDAQAWTGDVKGAEQSYHEAAKLREKLAASGKDEDKCLHARDYGNLAELYEGQGETFLDRAEERRRAQQAYCRTHLGHLPKLPGEYVQERADYALTFVELLLDRPALPGRPVRERFDEANRWLTKAEEEYELLMEEDGKSPTAYGVRAGLAHALITRARYELVHSRTTYRPAQMAEAVRWLAAAEQLLTELDGAGKAMAAEYYDWAVLMALRGQLVDTDGKRAKFYILSLDRLEKAMQLGFVRHERLKRDLAFAPLRLDPERAPQLGELTDKCAKKCAACKPDAPPAGPKMGEPTPEK